MNTVMRTITASVLTVSALAGCASAPVPKETTENRTVTRVPEAQSMRATFIGHHLLNAEQQNDLFNRAKNNQDLNIYVTSIAASQAITGNVLSAKGRHTVTMLSLGTEVAFYLFEGQGYNDTSGLYIPENFDGQELNKTSQATQAARVYTVRRIQQASKAIGRAVLCIDGCSEDSTWTVFELTRNGPARPQVFDQETVYLTLKTTKLTRTKSPGMPATFLGFWPKFETAPGDNWSIELFAKKEDITEDPSIYQTLENTVLAEELFREIYSDVHLYRVRNSRDPGRLYYDNEVYALGVRTDHGLIEGKITPLDPDQLAISSK